MPETVAVKNIGLRGVVVADTAVSFIDGQEGILIYRGTGSRSWPKVLLSWKPLTCF